METREGNYLKNITRIEAAKLQCCLEMDKLFNTVLICFVNYYFIQARSATLSIVLWRMWKNYLKNVPGQGNAYVMTKACGGGFNTFFSTSVDIACLQQLIWERICSVKERDWNKTSASLLVRISTSKQHLSSAGNVCHRSNSYMPQG